MGTRGDEEPSKDVAIQKKQSLLFAVLRYSLREEGRTVMIFCRFLGEDYMRFASLVFAVCLCSTAFGEVTNLDVALIEDKDGSLSDTMTQAMPNVWLQKAACLFYATHDDRYDALFVFTTIPMSMLTNVQQGWPVRQISKGIGRTPSNQTAQFCAKKGRLRQAVKMGTLSVLPNNPDDRYTGIPGYALSGVELMAHEFGHQWLASITFMKEDGVRHCYIRGYEPMSQEVQPGDCDGGKPEDFNQHWSYYFNSHSVMYGSFIEDLGNGRFRLYYKNPKYSELDQYLMGLRLKEEVPPMFLIETQNGLSGSASLPSTAWASGVEVEGQRVDFTIDDVIRAEGEREPPLEPCHWKGALILAYPAGKPPSVTDIQKVVAYGNRFESFYDYATDHRGSFDLTIDGRGAGTLSCPASGIIPPEVVEQADTGGEVQEDAREDKGWFLDFGPPPETIVLGEDVFDLGQEGGRCVPGSVFCHPFVASVVKCNNDGTSWTLVEDCRSKGMRCEEGKCVSEVSGSGGGCNASRDMRAGSISIWVILAVLWRFLFIWLGERRRKAHVTHRP